jgi:hypothetical protein
MTLSEKESSVSAELMKTHEKQLDINYLGTSIFKEREYWLFTIKSLKDACNEEKALNILIPQDNSTTSDVRLIFCHISLNKSPFNNRISQPTTIITLQKAMTIDYAKHLLLSESWKGYPTTLILWQQQNDNDQVTISYRSSASDNIQVHNSDISEPITTKEI